MRIFTLEVTRVPEASSPKKLFHAVFQAYARARWKFDNIADLARVLRLPSSWTWKSSPPLPVGLRQYSGRRYHPGDLEEYFPASTPEDWDDFLLNEAFDP